MKYGIELTNDCNLKCEMCPRNYIDMEIGYMDKESWHSIINWIPKGSTILPFWRGESTLHPDFCEMINELDGYDVVLATNGTNPKPVIDVLSCLSSVNVSIHNQDSYAGYMKILGHVYNSRPNVIASMVEGEFPLTTVDRIYRKHTVNGVWGKVEGMDGTKEERCSKMDEVVITWDGNRAWCAHVWDIFAPQSVCSTCNQWMGNGRTL